MKRLFNQGVHHVVESIWCWGNAHVSTACRVAGFRPRRHLVRPSTWKAAGWSLPQRSANRVNRWFLRATVTVELSNHNSTAYTEDTNKTQPLNTVRICPLHKHATRAVGFDTLMQWHQKASRNFEFCPMFWWPWYDDTIRWVHQSTTLTSAKRLLCWCTSKLTQSNMGRSPWKLLMSCISQGIERFLHKGMSPYKNVRHSMKRCQATIKMHSHPSFYTLYLIPSICL